jgi:predicted O-methyltransferase YrrM
MQTQHYADLNYPNKKQYLAFPSYTCMVDFAERQGCKNILEIGAGLSTAVWADFAKRSGANVCTIDASVARMKSYVRNTGHEQTVSVYIDLVEGTTIHSEDLVDFFTGQPKTSYGGIDVAAFSNRLDLFRCQNCSTKRWHKVSRITGRWGWSAADLLTKDSALHLARPLLDLYSQATTFDDAVTFLKNMDEQGKGGMIDKLTANGDDWDFIFFDSGELASMVEWPILKDNIAIGGYAAFHDIYFPKSIKNIVPCAAVMADPDWEMVFCDDSTKQGLMIAQRLR